MDDVDKRMTAPDDTKIPKPRPDVGSQLLSPRPGVRYEQDAVLYKPYDEKDANLLGVIDGPRFNKREEQSVGPWHPSRVGEYYGLIQNGHRSSTPTSFEGVGASEALRDVTFWVALAPLMWGRGREREF